MPRLIYEDRGSAKIVPTLWTEASESWAREISSKLEVRSYVFRVTSKGIMGKPLTSSRSGVELTSFRIVRHQPINIEIDLAMASDLEGENISKSTLEGNFPPGKSHR